MHAPSVSGLASARSAASRTCCTRVVCSAAGSNSGSSRVPGSQQGSGRPTTARSSQAVNQVPANQQLQDAAAAPPVPVPLKYVVKEAVRRWYYETQQDAMRGDVKAQALLGQMLAEGYGCEKDLSASKEWIEKSWMRGYRMMGVYCEL